VLDRLTVRELITHDRDEADNGRLRRCYALTDAGAGALAAEADRIAASADAARRRLRLRVGGTVLGGGKAA
jgi:DNA-binding PadR family transcriptional regulator